MDYTHTETDVNQRFSMDGHLNTSTLTRKGIHFENGLQPDKQHHRLGIQNL